MYKAKFKKSTSWVCRWVLKQFDFIKMFCVIVAIIDERKRVVVAACSLGNIRHTEIKHAITCCLR